MKPPRTAEPRLPSGPRKAKPSDELDFDEICEAFRKFLTPSKSLTDAKEAKDVKSTFVTKPARAGLAELVKAGSDKQIIIQNLFLFCGGKPAEMKHVRRQLNLKGAHKRILELPTLLKKACTEIDFAEQQLELAGIGHSMKPNCDSIQQYALFLERFGNKVYKQLASGRSSGRNRHLVFLVVYIERVTGRKHYREIADLVAAMTKYYNPASVKHETALSIRKRVERHLAKIDEFARLQMMLEIDATISPNT